MANLTASGPLDMITSAISRPPASVTLPADAVHADAHTDLLVFHTDFGGAA